MCERMVSMCIHSTVKMMGGRGIKWLKTEADKCDFGNDTL